jgi:hypothetical protein
MTRLRRPAAVFLALPLVLAACQSAQPQFADGPQYMREAIEEFSRQHPDWTVAEDPKSHRPRLSGPGFPIKGVQAWTDADDPRSKEAEVTGYLRGQTLLLGARGLEPQLVSAGRAGNAWFYYYSWQTPQGVPLVARADVAIHRNGNVMMLSSAVPPDYEQVLAADLPKVPADHLEHARVVVQQLGEVQATKASPVDARLEVHWDQHAAKPSPARTAVRVRLDRPAKDGTHSYVIDAIDGTILSREGQPRHIVPMPTVDVAVAGDVEGVPQAERKTPPILPAPAPGGLTIQLSAMVRTGHAANGAVEAVPMPGIEILGFGKTDQQGQLIANVAPGAILETWLSGDWCNAFSPSPPLPWQRLITAGDAGTIVQWQIEGTDADKVVQQATISYWLQIGITALNRVMSPSTLPASVVPLFSRIDYSIGGGVPCGYYSDQVRELRFSGEVLPYRSFAFASVILHELGHAVDGNCDHVFGDYGVSEAYADIVAMFVLDDPKIGDQFQEGSDAALRSGANVVLKGSSSSSDYGHAGECLDSFAWQSYVALQRSDFVKSLFLGQAWGNPPTVDEYVRRVLLAASDPKDPRGPNFTHDQLRAIAAPLGL